MIIDIAKADNGKTEISQSMIPLSITVPGNYILTENVIGVSGTNGITIFTNNVTVDLNGFSLTGVTGALNGIQAVSNSINIKIVNGFVNNWGYDGIDMGFSKNCIFKSIISSYNKRDGINVGFGAIVMDSKVINNGPIPHDHDIDYGNGIEAEQNSIITRCIATGNNQHGIIAHSGSTVADCTMLNNGHDGIHGSHNIVVTGCAASGDDEGIEVDSASIISDSTISHNTGDGIRLKRTGYGCGLVRNCTTYTNNQDGLDFDVSSIVIGCNSYRNIKHGFRLEPDSRIDNNISTYNTGAGIKLSGSCGRAENNLVLNNSDGIKTSNRYDDYDNLIELATNNIIIMNISDDYSIKADNQYQKVNATDIIPDLPDIPWINIKL